MLQDLTDLLDDALRNGLQDSPDLHHWDMPFAWMYSNQAHVQESYRAKIYADLEANPEVQAILGKFLNVGPTTSAVPKEAIGDWLLTRALRVGAARAVAELREFIAANRLVAEEYLAVSGLKVTSAVQLPGGMELVPIEQVPESSLTISLADPTWSRFKRDAKGHVIPRTVNVIASIGQNTMYDDPHVAMAVFRVQHVRSPAFVAAPMELPSAQDAMQEAAQVIAAVMCTAIFPVAHWIAPTPDVPVLSRSWGWTKWNHVRAFREFATVDLQANAIISALNQWFAIDASMKKRLLISLDRLNRAFAATNVSDAAIDLGVCLEALLLFDLEPNDQISLAFRLRGAWLLGNDVAERRALVQRFNAIYTCRSAVVHKGELPPKMLKIDGVMVQPAEFIAKVARPLAARAVLTLIERGQDPDWAQVLVGAENTTGCSSTRGGATTTSSRMT